MSSIGPQLPPHLAKRKRTPEHDQDATTSSPPAPKTARTIGPTRPDQQPQTRRDDSDSGSDSDDGFGPSAPQAPAGPAAPTRNAEEIDLDDDDDDSDVGPSLPPSANATAQSSAAAPPPPASESGSDSDSDDDYGPALPKAGAARPVMGPARPPSPDEGPKRDSWMLAPPTATGYAERDPTRIRARKFASKSSSSAGAGAAGGGGVSSIWTETPEEKLQRLQDSVLGRSGKGGASSSSAEEIKAREAEERNRKISANIESSRGKSLYEQHSQRRKEKGVAPGEEEDDPSKRAFDKEKDMALGGQLGTAQRRELMNRSADFGGRFQRGNFL